MNIPSNIVVDEVGLGPIDLDNDIMCPYELFPVLDVSKPTKPTNDDIYTLMGR